MEVKEVLERYIEATNSHVFKNVAKYVSSDAIYWFTKNEYKTLAEIQGYFENTWDLIIDEVYSIANINWIAVDENTATCLYDYHWQGYYNGGACQWPWKSYQCFYKD